MPSSKMKDKREALIQELCSKEYMVQGVYFDAGNETKWFCHWDIQKIAELILARERSLRDTMGKVREVLECMERGLSSIQGTPDYVVGDVLVGIKGALALLNEAEEK